MKKRFLLLPLLMAAISNFAIADDAAIKQSLGKMGINDAEIQPSPLPGTKTVITTSSGILYISDDGKYLIQGPLYNISGAAPINETNKLLLGKLNAFSKDMIVYKAPDQKYVVTVFTDITCGYCKKLHKEMKDYNALGITIRYLAFPRQGLNSDTEKEMKDIWCAKEPAKAFDAAMQGDSVPSATCDMNLAQQFNLGVQFGVQGTPAMVLEDGTLLPGYQGPKELKKFLDAHQKATTMDQ